MNKIFTDVNNLLYLPTHGIIQSRVNLYTEFVHECAQIFFKILMDHKLEFFLFAGSSIGFLRDKKSIPWVDDYDIIIFEDQRKLFDKKIIPILKENGFICFEFRGGIMKVEYHAPKITNDPHEQNKFFLCDIFYSKVEGIFVKNIAKQGLYDKKNIPVSWVKPARWVKFDGLSLPFFNKIEEDVKLEYGDIFGSARIHVEHGKENIKVASSWKDAYAEFKSYKNKAIENTKKLIYKNKNYTPINKIIINSTENTDIFTVLRDLSVNNITSIDINDYTFMKFLCNIKYYYPKIKIKLNVTKNNKLGVDKLLKYKLHMEYLDEIYIETDKIKNILTSKKLYYNKFPKIT